MVALVLSVALALASPSPQEGPLELRAGEVRALVLAPGGSRTLSVLLEAPGLWNVDVTSGATGLVAEVPALDAPVLAAYRDGEPAAFVRLAVRVGEPASLLVDLSHGGEGPARVEVAVRAGVLPLDRGEPRRRADWLGELGQALASQDAWPEAAVAHWYSGEIDYALEEFERCWSANERTLEAAERAGNLLLSAAARMRLGAVELWRGRPEAALEHLRPSLEAAVALGNPSVELIDRIFLGQALRGTGAHREALEMLDRALALAEYSGNASEIAQVRRELATTFGELGDVERAVTEFRLATELARDSGDMAALARGLLREAMFLKDLGHFGKARELLSEAGSIDLGPHFACEVRGELGNLERRCGNELAALEQFTGVLDAARELGNGRLERAALISLGSIHFGLGEWDEARAHLTPARALFEEDEAVPDRVMLLHTMADVESATGQLDEAAPLAEQAVSLAQRIGDPEALARALSSRVEVHMRMERHGAALEDARRMATLGREHRLALVEGVALDLEAEIHLRDGRPAEAAPLVRRALELIRASGDRWILQWALLTAVQAALDAGDLDGARAHVEEAEECFAYTGLELADPVRLARRRATDVFAEWGANSQDVVARFRELEGEDSSEWTSVMLGGFRRASFWKARGLLRGIVEHRVGGRNRESMELRRGLRDVRAEEVRLLERIAEALREGDEDEAGVTRLTLEEVRVRRDRLQGDWERVAPRDVALELPRGVPVEKLEALLADDEVLIEYAEGTESLFAYVLSDRGLEFHDLGQLDQVRVEVEAFLAGISDPSRLAPLDDVVERGAGLYERLLEPLVERDPGARLILVPTPSLATLPFEALVVDSADEPKKFRDVTFVLDQREVGYVSSTTVIEFLTVPSGANDRARRALILADPDYESGASPGDAASPRWARLPGTRREATEIARTLLAAANQTSELELLAESFDRSRSFAASNPLFELRVGSEASRASLDRDLREFDLLHFASHGWLDAEDARRTGLVLGSAGDGHAMLTLADILELDLDAELAVLSACETGRGRVLRSEGVLSLARAFLFAGARSVVSSLWPVDDRETQLIMSGFYRELVGNGAPKLSALRAARLAVRSGDARPGAYLGTGRGEDSRPRGEGLTARSTASAADRVGHPYFWASFVLVGDWR